MSFDFKINENEYLPLRDVVYNALRDAIIHGQFTPGERLMESQLSKQMGVSRTPIREALRKLSVDGFVQVSPRKGAIVAKLTATDIENVLEIRCALEGLAAGLAASKRSLEDVSNLIRVKDEFVCAANANDVERMTSLDVELHNIIFSSTGNPKLTQIINNLYEQIHRYRVMYLNDSTRFSSILKEHEEIVSAIQNQNVPLAESLAEKHIKTQQEAVKNLL